MIFPAPLYYSNVRLLWFGRFFSSASSFFQFVVIGWLTYEYTQSPFLTSLSWGFGALSGLISAPIGGFAADKWNRQKVIVNVFLLKSIFIFLFAYLVISGNFNTYYLFIFLLSVGFIQSLGGPSDFSLIPLLVPTRRNLIFAAYAITGSAYFVGHFSIPYFAGLLLKRIGPGFTLIGQLIMILISVLAYSRIQTIRPQEKLIKNNFKENFIELINFLKTNRLLQGALLLRTSVNVLVVPAVHGLLPIYTADIFSTGPDGYGLLFAILGVGGFFSDFSLSILVNYVKKGTLLLFYLMFVFFSMYSFSLAQSLSIGLICVFFLNFGLISILTIGRSLLGSEVPDKLRGRFGGIFNFTNVLSILGTLLAGILAENYSVTIATQVCCVILLIFVVIVFISFPTLRRLQ
ncbi:MAG: MFS transporter [SAR202 cluster bacterium]|nr:MFS transporter [SAR202 cluster bacterium]|tara:strand:+ start:35562 stop:36773 length:1212 start_codon:yes stop_codon:yes gene_type:complete